MGFEPLSIMLIAPLYAFVVIIYIIIAALFADVLIILHLGTSISDYLGSNSVPAQVTFWITLLGITALPILFYLHIKL